MLEELGTASTRVTAGGGEAGPVGVVMGRLSRRLIDRYLTAEAEGMNRPGFHGGSHLPAGVTSGVADPVNGVPRPRRSG